jgi:hypothetical protein
MWYMIVPANDIATAVAILVVVTDAVAVTVPMATNDKVDAEAVVTNTIFVQPAG